MRLSLFAVFATILSVTGPSFCGDDAKKDQDALQGAWQVVEFTVDGKALPEQVRKDLTITFKADKMQLGGPGGAGKKEFSYKLDTTKKPKAIELTALDGPFKDKPGPGIYEVKGDELKLCLPNDPTQVRPTEFKSADGSKVALFVLKRAK